MNTADHDLIGEAYESYLEGKDLMNLTTWLALDDANISPAGLWDLFDDGLTPVDLFINPQLLENNHGETSTLQDT